MGVSLRVHAGHHIKHTPSAQGRRRTSKHGRERCREAEGGRRKDPPGSAWGRQEPCVDLIQAVTVWGWKQGKLKTWAPPLPISTFFLESGRKSGLPGLLNVCGPIMSSSATVCLTALGIGGDLGTPNTCSSVPCDILVPDPLAGYGCQGSGRDHHHQVRS